MMLETRDPYTAGHQRRVSALARSMAQEMGLSKDVIDNIRMAGNIHDIGKMSVPAEVLVKPTRLSAIEMQLIRTHPRTGYDILKVADLPYPIAEAVLQHHERLDGSGYPQGLKGDEILIEACILSVADVVEAMAFDRPYRPALGIDVALEEIERNRGIAYRPEAADACLRLFREKVFKFE
ncbi:MAG: Cyclic di-GMP phosphodiesterase response regulator RpfG [Syntrophorhabdus sp. PtaB.Bin184]|nr:MAG: Cyclic di-GMP phosphodiesterase response regulator RpfG [Syntrophorhabdus sp. PtaB.Bin184]